MPLNVLPAEENKDPWYKEGLSFKCTGCGKCCTGTPGYVWVNEQEIKEMADFLQLSVEKFSRLYLRRAGNRYSLIELAKKNYDCVFLEGKQCRVYAARPQQCRIYPWWPQVLKSKEAWDKEATFCEGIDHPSAPVVPYAVIREQLQIIEEKS